MANYKEQLQKFWDLYREAGHDGTIVAKDVAAWAYDNGLWQPRPADVIKVLAEDLAKAWREEYKTDEKGRRYRTKHPVRRSENGQMKLEWEDMRTAPREHMEMAFSQRRQQIVGDCLQLKVDVDVYNDFNPNAAPIQLPLDFTYDVEEALLSGEEFAA